MTATEHGGRGRIGAWWSSRYGARLMIEIAICGGLLIIYRLIRGVNKGDLQSAFSNTAEVIRFERWLGLPFEDDLQAWLLDHPTLIKLLNHYYIWFHFPAAIALLLWLFVRHQQRYYPIRNLMAFITFAALIIHLLYPLAPPRMMSGFVDTMRVYGPSIYPPNALEGAANQIAAMPSLHFGWAMIIALAVISVLKSPWRWLIVIHPMLMTLSIIATANHWWIDAAAAGVLIVVAMGIWQLTGHALGRTSTPRRPARFHQLLTDPGSPRATIDEVAARDEPPTAGPTDVDPVDEGCVTAGAGVDLDDR